MRAPAWIVCTLLVASCANKTIARKTLIEMSCDKRDVLSQCVEYSGLRASAHGLADACNVVKGTFGKVACPAGWVGSCELGSTETRHYYASGGTPFRVESAQRECRVLEGRWEAAR